VDLNGDGILDVTSGQYTPGIVTFFEGTPTGFRKGVPIEEVGIDPRGKQDMKTTMATANFVDWDGDGDYDMIVGNVLGEVFVNINQGTPKQFKFGQRVPVMAAGKPIKVTSKSDPLPVDWDGDGVLDLLVGDEMAGITFFRGVKGPAGAERTFKAGVPLIPGKEKVVPGYRLRLAVADWNNDGKLDLLVGNCERVNDVTTGNVYLFLRK
jgi:hypothetical protein